MIDVIWTTHLKERAAERGIDPRSVEQAIHFPDKVEASQTTTARKHIKVIDRKQIVAAVKREGNNWIVTSVWSKPYYGPSLYKQWWLERLIHRFVLWLGEITRN